MRKRQGNKMNDNKAERAVEAIEGVFGSFPGYRRAHARGYLYKGTFTPNGQASALTTAFHLQEQAVPVFVRFSNSSPNPNHTDGLSLVKGMSVQFQLPDGGTTDLITVTIPIFFAKTPEDFLKIFESLKEVKEGSPNLQELAKLAGTFPEIRKTAEILKETRSPASFASAHYYSIHAFYLVDAHGRKQAIKFQWKPDDGIQMYKKAESLKNPADFLEQELEARLAHGPVGFDLNIQMGREEDPTDDPTVLWPQENQLLTVGHLSINGRLNGIDQEIMFDPTNVVEGIECSEDRILNFRHEAYPVSYGRRSRNE